MGTCKCNMPVNVFNNVCGGCLHPLPIRKDYRDLLRAERDEALAKVKELVEANQLVMHSLQKAEIRERQALSRADKLAAALEQYGYREYPDMEVDKEVDAVLAEFNKWREGK